jgi:hypothetical protein
MDQPAGPIVSDAMIKSRLEGYQNHAAKRVHSILDGVGEELNMSVTRLITDAYLKGLADGFSQRVYADGLEDGETS